MGASEDIRAQAATWRAAARLSRERARRVASLGGLRWEAPAAEEFRVRLGERAAGLRRLAELEDSVGEALDGVAGVLDDAERVLVLLGASRP